MAKISRSLATLRVMGENLIPDAVTDVLGCDPTKSQIKGQEFVGRNTGRVRIARFGMWRLVAEARRPEDLDSQVFELLDLLSQDLRVWRDLASRFKIDLFVGLFMKESNEGLELSAKSLAALGERGITLGLDIYDPDDEDRHREA